MDFLMRNRIVVFQWSNLVNWSNSNTFWVNNSTSPFSTHSMIPCQNLHVSVTRQSGWWWLILTSKNLYSRVFSNVMSMLQYLSRACRVRTRSFFRGDDDVAWWDCMISWGWSMYNYLPLYIGGTSQLSRNILWWTIWLTDYQLMLSLLSLGSRSPCHIALIVLQSVPPWEDICSPSYHKHEHPNHPCNVKHIRLLIISHVQCCSLFPVVHSTL